jgi:hypothetical protein
LNQTKNIGQEAAYLKWTNKLTWPEVFAQFPKHKPNKVRAAARRWKAKHKATINTPHGNLGVEFKENNNTAEARSLGPQIQTLKDLIDVLNIDTTIWEVATWDVKTYDGWRGNAIKDLRFDEGKITGYIKDDGIATQTLFSINARFIRKKPILVSATFSVIKPASEIAAPKLSKNLGCETDLVLSDLHIGFDKTISTSKLVPYHDRIAISIILQIATTLQPDRIIILGDLVDLAQWSKNFCKSPEFYWATQPALEDAYWVLAALRKLCPNSKIILIEGNHDVRLPRYVQANMIEACELTAIGCEFPCLSLPHLLSLKDLHIEWVGGYANGSAIYSPYPWIQYLHGNIARTPGLTAKVMVENSIQWRVFGHIHRCEIASRSFAGNPPISAISFGCLCHTDGRVPGSSPGHQWQKRFGIISHDDSAESVNIEIISVEYPSTIWRGETYKGEDYTDQLREAWSDWNW